MSEPWVVLYNSVQENSIFARQAVVIIRMVLGPEESAGCSKRLSSKAAASEEARRTLRYVEPLSDARTTLASFFSILLVFDLRFGKVAYHH